MGIDVALLREDGEQLDYVGDPKGRIGALLPPDGDTEHPMLMSIDFYGNTIFNRIQMTRFLAEWTYSESQAETEYEKTLVAAVRRMGTRCRDDVHLYLKFIGD